MNDGALEREPCGGSYERPLERISLEAGARLLLNEGALEREPSLPPIERLVPAHAGRSERFMRAG